VLLSSNEIRERIDESGEYDDDREVLELKAILAALRVTLANERKAAIAGMETDVSNAQQALEQAKIDQQNSVEQESADQERQTRDFHSRLSYLKIEMVDERDALIKLIEKSTLEFSENLGKFQRKVELEIANMGSQINNAKSELEKLDLDLVNRRAKELCDLEAYLLRQTTDLAKQIGTTRRTAEHEQQLLNMAQSEAVGKRDLAKQLFVERGPRPEEDAIVTRLEGVLGVVSKELGVLLKEYQYYRSKIQTQESDYNERFGAAPHIAVLKGGSPTRIPMKKPLPPLHNSVKC
jgi:hypothetical protein